MSAARFFILVDGCFISKSLCKIINMEILQSYKSYSCIISLS